jgi:hypothetical protein
MKCACGCERSVPLRQARDNTRARAAAKLVTEMEAMGFAADADEYRRAFLFEGVSWRNQYTRIVHGELTREQIRSDAAWKAWRNGARGAVRAGRA